MSSGPSLLKAGRVARAIVPAAAIAVLCAAAPAEEIVFFDAETAGELAWSWGSARLQREGTRMIVKETNKTSGYGDVYPSSQFPYVPDAEVKLGIGRVRSGSYTFQILCFRGQLLRTVDVIKDSKESGDRTFRLGNLEVPPETQSVMFKLWVANEEGASLILRSLKYSLDVDKDKVLADITFKETSPWKRTDVVALPVTGGMRVTPVFGKAVGNMGLERGFPATNSGAVILYVPQAARSVASLQLDILNASNQFMQAINVFDNVGSGWHGSPLSILPWPEGAAAYKVKLWVSGQEGAYVDFGRLLVLAN